MRPAPKLAIAFLLLVAVDFVASAPSRAVVFTVDSALDEVDKVPGDGVCRSNPSLKCTLRAAIMEHDVVGGSNTIVLPAGTYKLTIAGNDQSNPANGSLDVNAGTLAIEGAGAPSTVIDGNGLVGVIALCDGNFGCATAPTLRMNGVTVRNAGVGSSFFSFGNGITLMGDATLVLLDSVVKDNPQDGVFGYGPGVHVMVEGSTVANNGNNGISNEFSGGTTDVTVTNSTVDGNAQGIHSTGGLTVFNTTVSNSTIGGGIEVLSSDATIANSTISGNTTFGDGGGIDLVYAPANVTVTNTTVSGNKAPSGYGGGIYVHSGDGPPKLILTVNDSTITNNTAGYASSPTTSFGGGIGVCGHPSGTEVHLANTILAGNIDVTGNGPESTCCSGFGFDITEHGYNLFDPGHPGTCTFAGDSTGDVFGNPGLGPLANNGGPTGATTFTHRLLLGSPAINAGNPSTPGTGPYTCATTDQRGIPRPLDTGCDIGAYETSSSCASDTDQDGICDTSDTCGVFNPDGNDLDGDGTKDLCDTCPGDSTNGCGAGGGIAKTIDSGGGEIALGRVHVDVPPSAVPSSRSFSITNLTSGGYVLETNMSNVLSLVRLGPENTSFAPQKANVIFSWPKTFTNDGNLVLFKNGKQIGTCSADASILCTCNPPACQSVIECPSVGQCAVKTCGNQGCPSGSASCCDRATDRWTIQTSSFSEFVFGADCAPMEPMKLVIRKVGPPDGDESFTWKGTFDLAGLTLGDLDPVAHGLNFFLSDGSISHEINGMLSPGLYDPQTKHGWKVSAAGHKWTLVSVPSTGSPLPYGIKKVVVHEFSPRKPGIVSFKMTGSQSGYPTMLPVEAKIILPGAQRCFAPNVGGAPPAPTCSTNSGGTTLTCK